MSGGHYNYQYQTVFNLAAEIEPTTPNRIAFIKLLKLVGKACHDIEWVDSGDYAPGDEDEAINEVIKSCKELE